MFDALNVALNASDTISNSLRDISSRASDVSQEFAKTAGSSIQLGSGMQSAENTLEDVEGSLSDVTKNSQITAEAMGHLQSVVEQVGDESQQVSADFRLLDKAMRGIPNEAIKSNKTLSALDNTLDDVRRSTFGTTMSTHALAEGMDRNAYASARATLASQRLEAQLEQVGDEAVDATAAINALTGSVGAFSLTNISANLGPFSGSLRTILITAVALLPILLSVGAALGGIAAAAGAAAAGIAALFGAGLLSRAEGIAKYSKDIEGTAEALQQIFSNLGDAIARAAEPLQQLNVENFAFGALEGFVEWVSIAAESLAYMGDMLMDMANSIGGAFLDESPEFFAELENMLRVLGPIIEDILIGLIRDVPDLLAFMTEETAQMLPILGQFGDALIKLLAPLSEIGTAMMSILLPALSLLMTALGGFASALASTVVPAVELFGSVLNTVINHLRPIISFVSTLAGILVTIGSALWLVSNSGLAFAAVMGVLSSVGTSLAAFLASGLTGSLYAVAAASWAAIGPWGIAIGLIVALITHFGLLDDVIGGVVSIWNALVELVEFVINLFMSLISWISDVFGAFLLLMGPIGWVIYLLGNLGDIISFVGDLWEGLVSGFQEGASIIGDIVKGIVGLIGGVMNALASIASLIPGISLDGVGDVEEQIDLSALQTNQEMSGETPAQPENDPSDAPATVEERQQQLTEERNTNLEIGSIDASGSDTTEARIRRIIRDELQRANEMESRRS